MKTFNNFGGKINQFTDEPNICWNYLINIFDQKSKSEKKESLGRKKKWRHGKMEIFCEGFLAKKWWTDLMHAGSIFIILSFCHFVYKMSIMKLKVTKKCFINLMFWLYYVHIIRSFRPFSLLKMHTQRLNDGESQKSAHTTDSIFIGSNLRACRFQYFHFFCSFIIAIIISCGFIQCIY